MCTCSYNECNDLIAKTCVIVGSVCAQSTAKLVLQFETIVRRQYSKAMQIIPF